MWIEWSRPDFPASSVTQEWTRQALCSFTETLVGGLPRLWQAVLTMIAMNNMLFDTESKRISAMLDFDWAAIGHPGEEFFTSFHDVKGTTRMIHSEELQKAILPGSFGDGLAKDVANEEEHEAWELARAWDAALQKHGAIRPSDIKGMVVLEKLRSFTDLLAPFELANKAMLKRRSAEDIAVMRAKTEEAIVKGLEQFNDGG